jgi:hypothetical protein
VVGVVATLPFFASVLTAFIRGSLPAGRVIGLITLSGMKRFIQLKTDLEEEEQ